jgi:hypothetical protein
LGPKAGAVVVDRGQDEWVISVQQWAEIRRMRFVEGLAIRETDRR